MKNIIKILTVISLILASCSHIQQSLDENVTVPILKDEPKLIYPFKAQQNNWYGTTTVIFTITNEGIVDQTRVHNSSGYTELDRAAENYCKGLLFIPAKQNGKAISANMKWDVKFNLKDFGREIRAKINDVEDLYSELEYLKTAERFDAQNEILNIHKEIISGMKDGLKFNEYMYSVVKPGIKNEWKPVSELYPLTFLLYHDFITRYPDYDSLEVVKARMEYSLRQDLEYLQSASNIGYEYRINKSVLINKIKSLVESKYPEINIDDLTSEIMRKNNSIS